MHRSPFCQNFMAMLISIRLIATRISLFTFLSPYTKRTLSNWEKDVHSTTLWHRYRCTPGKLCVKCGDTYIEMAGLLQSLLYWFENLQITKNELSTITTGNFFLKIFFTLTYSVSSSSFTVDRSRSILHSAVDVRILHLKYTRQACEQHFFVRKYLN